MTEALKPKPEPRPEPEAGDELVAQVERFCRDMVHCMRMHLNVAVRKSEDALVVDFSGSDRPMLLSGTASLLNSFEYLLNKAFRSGPEREVPSILTDSEKYRQHREAELVLLAQMASKKVIEQSKPLSLQPMIPRERRIVHLALANFAGVRSQSDGDGDNRSITIYPA